MLLVHQDDIPSNGNRRGKAWIKKAKKVYNKNKNCINKYFKYHVKDFKRF